MHAVTSDVCKQWTSPRKGEVHCCKWCLNTLHFEFVSKSLPLLLDWFFADVASKDYSRLQCTLLNIASSTHHSVLLLWFFVAPLVLFSIVEMWQGFLVNVTEFPAYETISISDAMNK